MRLPVSPHYFLRFLGEQVLSACRFSGEEEIDDAEPAREIGLKDSSGSHPPREREIGPSALHVAEVRRDFHQQAAGVVCIKRSVARLQPFAGHRRRIHQNCGHHRAVPHQWRRPPREAPLHMWRGQSPFRDEPVGGRPLVQRARRCAVNVLLVFFNHDAEPCEVQMGVERLQGIVGPLDEVDSHAQGALALREFELQSQAGGSRVGTHAQHVRPLRHSAILQCGERIDEALHFVRNIEPAKENPTALDRDDQNRGWNDIFRVGVPPHELFQAGHRAAFLERGERADDQWSMFKVQTDATGTWYPAPYPGGQVIGLPPSRCRWM